jgi:gluconolactonase
MSASVAVRAPGLVEHGLIAADAVLEPIAAGFVYTEGPVWLPEEQALLFQDLPNDKRWKWTEAGGAVLDAEPTHFANGMALDAEGRLLVCEAGLNRVTRREADGTITVLASHYEGDELNSPNDIVVHSSGDIYFTDPAYGRIPVYGYDRPQELPLQGIYRIPAAGGEPELLSDHLIQPNGLVFSPDEQVLYVADCETGELIAFDVDAGGDLTRHRVFNSDAGTPLPWEFAVRDELLPGYLDGTAMDVQGNVYQTGRGGIWVIAPDGEALGVLELPEDVANLTWGEDGRTLFLCCRTTVFRTRMSVMGCVGPVAS